MSRERRDLWDKRNRTALPGEPEVSVREFEPLLPRGRALDVAAGPGRNSIALARAGMHVIAADFSPPAMRSLAALAARDRLAIQTVLADLEASIPFQAESFDVVLNVSFLAREMIPGLKRALRIGGMLLFDTFLIDQAAVGHPSDPRFLLGHYELRGLLGDMELIRYREGIVDYGGGKQSWRATALARRTA